MKLDDVPILFLPEFDTGQWEPSDSYKIAVQRFYQQRINDLINNSEPETYSEYYTRFNLTIQQLEQI